MDGSTLAVAELSIKFSCLKIDHIIKQVGITAQKRHISRLQLDQYSLL